MSGTLAPNDHQPEVYGERSLRCRAEDCDFTLFSKDDSFAREAFRKMHSSEYEPGRAPSIEVDWVVSASCTVCPDGIGTVEQDGGDSLICRECKTTWNIDGKHGERAEAEA